jgi:hypothetical protein
MDGESGYLPLDLGAGWRSGSRPSRAWPPATPARDRTGTWIGIDRQLDGAEQLRRPRCVPLQPPQPLDGQVRQEQ